MSDEHGPTAPVQDRPLRGFFRSVFFSESFVEKTSLILIAAAVSGYIVPVVVARVNSQAEEKQRIASERRTKEQAAASQLLARDEAILRAQASLLRDFSELVFAYQTLALDVSWFASDQQNEVLHKLAIERYSSRIVDLWSKYRFLVSQANFLASKETASKMNFLLEKFYAQDSDINTLLNDPKSTVSEWKLRHAANRAMLGLIDVTVSDLADELRLTRVHFTR